MLEITMTNGMCDTWNDGDFTEYEYRGEVFVLMQNDRWVGIYNMRDVSKIVYYDKPEEEN